MYLKIFNDAREKFYDDKSRQYIRQHNIKSCDYCITFKNYP